MFHTPALYKLLARLETKRSSRVYCRYNTRIDMATLRQHRRRIMYLSICVPKEKNAYNQFWSNVTLKSFLFQTEA